MNVGPLEIMVIMVVALLVFGPHRLPEVGRQVGGALRELRKIQDTVRGELDMVLHPEHGTSSSSSGAEPEDHTALASGSDPDRDTDDTGAYDTGTYDGAEWSDADWSDNGNGSGNGKEDASADDSRFLGPPDSFI